MAMKKQEQSKKKKILKGISRWFGGLLFFLALLILFTNLFASALVNNTDSFKKIISEEITDSEIFIDQLIEHSGATEDEIRAFCNTNPQEELCKVLDRPGEPIVESLGLDELDKNLEPVREGLKQSRIFIGVLFFLALLFSFLGKISVYDMLFKISRTVFIESALWFLMIIISPGLIPKLLDFLVPKDTQIPMELLDIALTAVDKWFDVALSNLKATMIGIIIVSLILAVLFYILDKKYNKL